MSYGLPYQGSKSAIADWVIGVLPAAATTNVKRIERIFIQERFAAEAAGMKGTLF